MSVAPLGTSLTFMIVGPFAGIVGDTSPRLAFANMVIAILVASGASLLLWRCGTEDGARLAWPPATEIGEIRVAEVPILAQTAGYSLQRAVRTILTARSDLSIPHIFEVCQERHHLGARVNNHAFTRRDSVCRQRANGGGLLDSHTVRPSVLVHVHASFSKVFQECSREAV